MLQLAFTLIGAVLLAILILIVAFYALQLLVMLVCWPIAFLVNFGIELRQFIHNIRHKR